MRGSTKGPCPDRVEALDALLQGLDPQPGLEAHLDSCKGCRQYYGRARGIESLLREAHDRFEDMPAGALAERRRISPARLTAMAAILLVVAAGTGSLMVAGRGGLLPDLGAGESGLRGSDSPGRIVLTAGPSGTLRMPGEAEVGATVGDRVPDGSLLEVEAGSGVAVRWEGGAVLVAGPDTRVRFGAGGRSDEGAAGARVMRVEEGSVTLLTQGTGALSAQILAGSWRVHCSAGVVTVRAGRGDLVDVASLRGDAVVTSPSGSDRVVPGGYLLASDGRLSAIDPAGSGILALVDVLARDAYRTRLTLTAAVASDAIVDGAIVGRTPVDVLLAEGTYVVELAGQAVATPGGRSVELRYGSDSTVVLDAVRGGAKTGPAVPVPDSGTAIAGDGWGEPQAAGPAGAKTAMSHQDVLSRIRQALAGGDTDEALALVEKNWKWGSGDAEFLSVAGDAYRRAGMGGEAVDAFIASAALSDGPAAERALIDAAHLAFEALGDLQRTGAILSGYWKRFPHGAHESEASMLEARLLVKQKNYAQARDKLEALIQADPSGYLATKAHLLLGSILVTYMSDCAAAEPHLQHVTQAAPGGKFADEARRYLDKCAD